MNENQPKVTTTIDIQTARGLLKRAMETKGPDFKYCTSVKQRCFYVPATDEYHDYGPNSALVPIPTDDVRRTTGCLIGVALDLHGETRHHGILGSVYVLKCNFPDLMTDAASKYFSEAQSSQDMGNTWGEAYERAERFFRLHLSHQEQP